MKRILLSILIASTFVLVGIALVRKNQSPVSQTTSKRWKQVEELTKKDLPKSVLQELLAIQNEERGEQGINDRVKASFRALETIMRIDSEKNDSLVADLEKKIAQAPTTVERTFLRFGLAEAIENNLLQTNKSDRALQLCKLTEKELNELSSISIKEHSVLLEGDSAWTEFFPTLDDYFVESRIRLLDQSLSYEERESLSDSTLLCSKEQFLAYDVRQSKLSSKVQTIVQSHQYLLSKKGIKEPMPLLRELNRLRLFQSYQSKGEKYQKCLEKLLVLHQESPYSVEIMAELALCETFVKDEAHAVERLNSYIERYAEYARIGILKKRRDEIQQGSFSVSIPRQVYPKKEFSIYLTYRKMNTLRLSIRRISAIDTLVCFEPLNSWTISRALKKNKISPDKEAVFEKTFTLPFSYKENKEHVQLKLHDGFYQCDIWENEKVSSSLYLLISPYNTVARSYNGVQDIQIADFNTWQPQGGMAVEVWDNQTSEEHPQRIAILKSDNYGRVAIPSSVKGNMYRVSNPKEKSSKWGYLPYVFATNNSIGKQRFSLYPDRPAYRPGQTLRFEGVAWNNDSERTAKGVDVQVSLLDWNGKKVQEWSVSTNSFGSFTGAFELPKEIKTGRYTLQIDHSCSSIIAIEEYKRPSLSITIEKITHLNEKSPEESTRYQIEGIVRSSNGIGLPNSQVRYFLNQYNAKSDTLTIQTDRNGRFVIQQQVNSHSFEPMRMNYRFRYPLLTCIATDLKGESQSTSRTLPYRGEVTVTSQLPEVVVAGAAQEYPIVINRRVASSTLIDGSFAIELNTKAEEWKTIETGTWKENGMITIGDKKRYESGRYRIQFSSNYFGKDSLVGTVQALVIHPNSKRMPTKEQLWSFLPTDTIDTGKEFEVWVGSSWGSVWAMVEVMNNKQFISRQYVLLNNSLNKLRFAYQSEWGKSVSVNVSAFVLNQHQSQQHLIVAREPNKTLHIEIQTLRNTMLPGQKETWTLSLKDNKGKPVVGEVLATLYDASLNQINPLQWNMSPFLQHEQLYAPNTTFQGYAYLDSYEGQTMLNEFKFPELFTGLSNWKNKSPLRSNRFEVKLNSPIYRNESMAQASTRQGDGEINIRGKAMVKDESLDQVGQSEETSIPVRQNFNESAFFFTQLRTNSKGEVKLPFTLPESLTSYSLHILAHDRNLRSGQIESTIQVQKPIMIGGNLPRFVYEGDSVCIKAMVFNLSTQKQKIQTAYTLSGVRHPIQEIELETGAQRQVELSFVAPADSTALTLTLSASTDGFGDAEQHRIPVLRRSQEVRETRIFNFPKGGTFSIEKPFAKETIGQLGVTYVGSPIYHLLEAVPTVPMPESENMIAWLNAYYLNQSAEVIGKRFLSETKNKRTPEQMQMLKNRLLAFQRHDGGFMWFEKMSSSTMLTLFFLQTTQRLGVNIGYELPEEIKLAQIKALAFMDKRLTEYYREDSVRLSKKLAVSTPYFGLLYLNIRGQFRDIPIDGKARNAHRFYLDQASKGRKEFSLTQKGLLASALFRYGRIEEAREVIRSLREYAVYSLDKGRYFANNRNPLSSNLCNINTQTEIMEAFALNLEYAKGEQKQTANELSEMATWLVYQKHGQHWGNAVTTINALNAILTYGVNQESLTMTGQQFATINLPVAQLMRENRASLEYSFTAEEWKKIANRLTIEKQSTDYSRLMVTWERRSPLEQIEASEGDLTIKQTIEANTPLQIGASTLRLTLTAKRDLDYLVVHSPRAACVEPSSQNSRYTSNGSLWFYHEIKDQGSNLYIEHLPRGIYTIDIPVWINLDGTYQQGVPTVESLFAPEFNGVGRAETIKVVNKE